MRDAFSTYHPAVEFFYFALVLFFTMFFLHPAALVISLAGGFSWSVYLGGKKALLFNLAALIPMLAVTALILVLGVSGGIEKISKFMMPAFFVLFLVIAVRVAFLPGAVDGYLYLLRPDWSYLAKFETWVMAMGQAFFSLSINGAGMLIYGSYMKKSENIIKQSCMTGLLDTCAALLAGFAILPAVFAFGIAPDRGPSLMFITLPRIFQQMPAGQLFSILFFLSVLFAGITSLINMLEAVGESVSKGLRCSRTVSVLGVSALTFGVGVFLEALPDMGAWMDAITIYIAPFGAVLAAVAIYWVLGLKEVKGELMEGRAKPLGAAFGFLAKYVYVFLAAAVLVFSLVYSGQGGIG